MHQTVNPVVFPNFPASEDLTVYSAALHEFNWKKRLVGLVDSGFLYVDERVARKGYYEFHPKVLDWTRVKEVKIGKYIDLRGVLLGCLLLALAVCAFGAGWIKKTHTGPGMVTIPLICGLGGGTLVFGALRNRIIVVTDGGTYRWNSGPLQYRKTLSICEEATARARSHGVFLLSSHVAQEA